MQKSGTFTRSQWGKLEVPSGLEGKTFGSKGRGAEGFVPFLRGGFFLSPPLTQTKLYTLRLADKRSHYARAPFHPSFPTDHLLNKVKLLVLCWSKSYAISHLGTCTPFFNFPSLDFPFS